eukprot:CAMPEP_0198203548 /NCGR_PEP_ID=MMETSP1445-20131203/6855_1 /TAXON_ID=36898 /ORGANISM="Pyramimonas sp., Strain CCMP2087" /LENGTH=309 /DNA_ID=CAMNT_0043874991 /DNA_START=248 /DNA_END=1177 /DNA_ORIENTATION=-
MKTTLWHTNSHTRFASDDDEDASGKDGKEQQRTSDCDGILVDGRTTTTSEQLGIVKQETQEKLVTEVQLTPSELRRVQKLWNGEGDETEILSAVPSGLQVTRGDLMTLIPDTWINDEVVNLYTHWMQSTGSSRVHIYSSFFWSRLASTPAGFDYKGVRRWTKKLNVFAFDLLIIPINHNNRHWCLAVVDVTNSTIEYYDSMGSRKTGSKTGRLVVAHLERYLECEWEDKRETFRSEEKAGCRDQRWRSRYMTKKRIPRQYDGSSCGIFMLAFAEQRARGMPFPFRFAQEDIDDTRRSICTRLLELGRNV